MDFSLTDEQAQIQAAARGFVEDRELIEYARRQAAGEDVIESAWDELVAMDYPALTVPIEHGGLGDGMVSLAVLLEELGRVALPAPFAETAAFAAPLLAESGGKEQQAAFLPAIADGDHRWTPALYEEGSGTSLEDVQLRATRSDGRTVLHGQKRLVPYGTVAEKLLVGARGPDGEVGAFVVDSDDPGVTATRRSTLDRTRPVAAIQFDGAPAEPIGGGLREAVDRLALGYCAMMVGAADRAVERSTEHGRTREQYGNPIGMYQAVKHRIADMWMDMQAARSLVYYAAWAVETADPDAPRAVSAATAFCGDVVPRILGDDVQNHGAMGFTTDHDAHISLKQAKTLRQYLGSPGDYYGRVADERGI